MDNEASSTKSKVKRGEGVTAAAVAAEAAWIVEEEEEEEVATTAEDAEADRKMLPRREECGDCDCDCDGCTVEVCRGWFIFPVIILALELVVELELCVELLLLLLLLLRLVFNDELMSDADGLGNKNVTDFCSLVLGCKVGDGSSPGLFMRNDDTDMN